VKILVCGSEGSLMQATIPHLREAGHEVRGVDSFFRYGRQEKQRDYEFMEGDLCDPALVKKACQGVDFIFQAAARIFGVVGFHKLGADILSRDIVLHQNVLWEALRQDVRKVVYISSSMVYERATRVPSEETDVDDMPVPLTDYGLSKLVGERLSRAFQKQYGLAYTVWRPFNIITPYEKGESEEGMSHVFADFIRKIVIEKQNPVSILGDGEQVRCFTWIGDVAGAIAGYSLDSQTDNEAFNLGNPVPTAMKDLALKIHQMARERGIIAGGEELAFRHLPIYQDDVRVRIPSIRKAQEKLGWEPKVNLDEALEKCLDVALGTMRKGNG